MPSVQTDASQPNFNKPIIAFLNRFRKAGTLELMPPKKDAEHRGFPTAASLKSFVLDQAQLVECGDCGAWVSATKTDTGDVVLEKHLDRRPKPANRNRQFTIRSGRGF